MSVINQMPTTLRIAVYDIYEFYGGGGILFSITDCPTSERKVRILIGSKMPYMPLKGDYCEVTGMLASYRDDDGRYVDQINAATCLELDPSLGAGGNALKCHLKYHLSFRKINVGREKLNRLFDTYVAEEVIHFLNAGVSSALTKVRGFTESTAKRLIDTWKVSGEERKIGSFLVKLSINRRLAGKVMQLWPIDTLQLLIDDPYLLLELSDWHSVDRMANKLKIGPNDDRRLCARIRAVMYERLIDGHTLTKLDTLLLLSHMSEKQVSRGIQLALTSRYIYGSEKCGYQSFNAFAIEERVRNELVLLMKHIPFQNQISERAYLVRADIEVHIKEYAAKEIAAGRLDPNGLTKTQCECIVHAMTRPFSVIVGSAGTGKKTIAKVIHDIEGQLGGSICHLVQNESTVCQIRLTTGYNAKTIDAFLREISNLEPPYQLQNDTLIMISDASMVDISTAYRLLSQVKNTLRLVLIGDDFHFPPLNYGLFFHKLANHETLSLRLTQVFENTEDCSIHIVAQKILKHSIPVLPRYTSQTKNVSYIECREMDIISSIELFLKASSLSIRSVQILANSKWLLDAINAHFQNLSNMISHVNGNIIIKTKMAFGNRREYIVDDPIIYAKDSLDRKLDRGALGKIMGIRKKNGTLIAECEFDGVLHEISREEMGRNVELGYAIPIHNNRGCAFPISIIAVTAAHSLINNIVLYSAFTRTMNQAILVGNLHEFNQIVQKQDTSLRREVGFTL